MKNGALGRTRTSDISLRRRVLYPTELRAHKNHFQALVRRGGLEPPTSPLSGARSNQLSYMRIPVQGQWSGRRDLNPWPHAWKARALPLSYARIIAASRMIIRLERAAGIEPAASTMARLRSTTELRPHRQTVTAMHYIVVHVKEPSDLGRWTGLEPATTSTTSRRSTN